MNNLQKATIDAILSLANKGREDSALRLINAQMFSNQFSMSACREVLEDLKKDRGF